MNQLVLFSMLYLNHYCADLCRDLGDGGGLYRPGYTSCRCYRDEPLDQGELAPMPISLQWYAAPPPVDPGPDDRE